MKQHGQEWVSLELFVVPVKRTIWGDGSDGFTTSRSLERSASTPYNIGYSWVTQGIYELARNTTMLVPNNDNIKIIKKFSLATRLKHVKWQNKFVTCLDQSCINNFSCCYSITKTQFSGNIWQWWMRYRIVLNLYNTR